MTKTIGELNMRILKHPRLALRAFRLTVAASALGTMCAYGQSVPLPPGSVDVPLPGITEAAEPDLAGLVLADQLISFTGLDGATGGIVSGPSTGQSHAGGPAGKSGLPVAHISITGFGNNPPDHPDSISGVRSFAGFNVNATSRRMVCGPCQARIRRQSRPRQQ